MRGETNHEFSWAGGRIAYVSGRNFHRTAVTIAPKPCAIVGIILQRLRDCIALGECCSEIVIALRNLRLSDLCECGLCLVRKIRTKRLPDIFVLAVGEAR
jgi:hypothetical protein